LDFARILSFSVLPDGKKPDPTLILKTLALYPVSEEVSEITKFDTNSNCALNSWLTSFGKVWSINLAAACATSFVSGDLLSYGEGDENGLVVTSNLERQRGAAVAKLCVFSGSLQSNSPSALLWPAINKGLSRSAPLGQSSIALTTDMGQRVARAIILLENGCKERVLGGVGHGDLVLDKDGNMLPPSIAIEMLLSRAVNFTLEQLRLVSVCNYDEHNLVADACGGRSTKSGEFANHFAILINQLMVLKKSYPSSVIMRQSLNQLLQSSLDAVLEVQYTLDRGDGNCSVNDAVKMMKSMAIIYGVLTVGAELGANTDTVEEEKEEANDSITMCTAVLALHFRKPDTSAKSKVATWQVKAMTSLFEHSRWGALMHLIPMAYKNASASSSKLRDFHNQVIKNAIDSVNACPSNALPALFEATVSSARESFDMFTDEEKSASNTYAKNIGRIIEALFAIMRDTSRNPVRAFMLNVTCSLLFQPQLVSEEFSSLQRIKKSGRRPNMKVDAPILQAFRKLMADAGVSKPHISKYVMSYISVGWLGSDSDKGNVGMNAIPYRLDIAKLLIHKEEKVEKSAAHQEGLVKSYDEGDYAILPAGVSQSSVVRGFLIVFISKLPDADDMNKEVLTKLCHYLILWLLDNMCLPLERTANQLLTTGSTEYVHKIRAWQALCMLHRFVTSEIATEVLKKVFDGMGQLLHGQIRYWIEVFTIQISRRNPTIFLNIFKNEIKRCDITQQHMSSLMIIGGNLFAGKYSDVFLKDITDNNAIILRDIIAGSVPWLSSTQGFCRAIAQLLVHKLIPIANDTMIQSNDTFFLETIAQFLDSNPEMIRLRKKQSAFFEEYDVDAACSPEGMFSYALDDGNESDPPHLVDILKRCLVDVYKEFKTSEIPEWKQLEFEMATLSLQEPADVEMDLSLDADDVNDEEKLVNFQRKILPIDTLNLTLENQRQASLRNAAGRTRQSLIVCASLIEKVTNLAGLTRTAEIFAAEKIMVPDAKVKKMDNFKAISVGAEEWVDIEECKEADLLPWLKARKSEGYSIIGIEQTSSSKCLSKVQFEGKSNLLLGKEKEGIPVEFLQVVDKCVEIPQLGLIRSLNVHVSGAISIWEYTKQMMAQQN
jgi:tRNA G18 (ribose-2'-O)-methylase SpoU